MRSCFGGKRIVVFSGGASKGTGRGLRRRAGRSRDGGGNGSIIGRNSFQRSREEALDLLGEIVKIYQGKA